MPQPVYNIQYMLWGWAAQVAVPEASETLFSLFSTWEISRDPDLNVLRV